MYRSAHQGSYRYRCSLYETSHGKGCNHNTVFGPTATAFTLGVIKRQLMQPHVFRKIEEKIRLIAERESKSGKAQERIVRLKTRFEEIQSDLKLVKRNLAFAEDKMQYQAIAETFQELTDEAEDLAAEIEKGEVEQTFKQDVESEIEQALQTINRLDRFTYVQSSDTDTARELIELVNARLYLQFRKVPYGKRQVNRLAGGIVTLGSVAPSIQLYDGRSDRKSIKALAGRTGKKNPGSDRSDPGSDPGNFVFPSGDAHSSGKVSCGDRI